MVVTSLRSRRSSSWRAGWSRLALLTSMAALLCGCDKFIDGMVDLFMGTVLLAAMGVVNVIALTGLVVSASKHSKGHRLWLPVAFAFVVTVGSMLVVAMAYDTFGGRKFTRFLLFGSLLPVIWLAASVALPLRVRRGLPDDPSVPQRNVAAIGGLVVVAGWFALLAIVNGGSISNFFHVVTTPPKQPEPPPPPEVTALRISEGHGCAETSRGLYCWPEMRRIELDGEVALWGAEVCTGDMSAVVCQDLGTDKRVRKIPQGVRRTLAMGAGGGCMQSWEQGVLCWKNGAEVHAIGGTKSVQSLAVGRTQACAVLGTDDVGCWDLGPPDAEVVTLPDFAEAKNVSAGDNYFCAQQAGRLKCWGSGRSVLSGPRDEPDSVPLAVGKEGLSEYSVGYQHACGIDEAGALWCWGSAAAGALGNGAFAGTVVEPLKVETPAAVKSVHAGYQATCVALRYSVDHYCWGRNEGGVLPVDQAATSDCEGVRCVAKPAKVVIVTGP